MTELSVLLISAFSLGFIHTLAGPDHYVPFIVLSKALKWSQPKTLWITFISGIGHVGSSVIIGIAGILLGFGVNQLESVESGRGNIVAWLLIAFGLAYLIFGIIRFFKPSIHAHLPRFLQPKSIRNLPHLSSENIDTEKVKAFNTTPWILFLIFVFGPCEVLIPLLIYPASDIHIAGMFMVAGVFGISTITTMLVIVYLGFKGIKSINLGHNEKYFHLIAGITIVILGLGMKFFGW